MIKVKTNEFALRQTPSSDFSHFHGTWQELEQLVEENFSSHVKAGESVVLVPLQPGRFYSAEAELKEGDLLIARYARRNEDEEPRKEFRVFRKKKSVAKVVNIVLYKSAVLEEDPLATAALPPVEGNWEIVSVNASLTDTPQEIPLMALLCNQFGVSGGTPRKFDSAEAELEAIKQSFLYWRDKAMISLES